jgi:hypothetical protein
MDMLLPRFTLRATLIGITVFAVLGLVLARAQAGDLWARAGMVAVASLLVIVVVHACFYMIIAATARVLGSRRLPARTRQGGVQASPDEHYLPGSAPPAS